MDARRMMKISVALVLLIGVFFSFTKLSTFALDKINDASNTYSVGTKIGPLDVSKKTKIEAKDQLSEKVQKWQAESSIIVQMNERQETISGTEIDFQINESVDLAEKGQENQILVSLAKKDAMAMIQSRYPGLLLEDFDMERLTADLNRIAASLDEGEHRIKLKDYLDQSIEDSVIVSEVIRNHFPITPELKDLLLSFQTMEISGNARFSLLNYINEMGLNTVDSEAASTIASVLYELILQTNFAVLERNQSPTLPGETTLGLEAKVDSIINQDFSFFNPNDEVYRIELLESKEGLIATLTGFPFDYLYEFNLEDERLFEPKTIWQYSAKLSVGQIDVQEPGQAGKTIKTLRTISGKDGQFLENELIAEDFYLPTHRIEIHSLETRVDVQGNNSDEDRSEDVVTGGDGALDRGNRTNPPTNEQSGKSDNQKDIVDGSPSKENAKDKKTPHNGIWTDPGDIEK